MDKEEFLPFVNFLQNKWKLLNHNILNFPALAIKIQDKMGRTIAEVVQLQKELEEHLN